MGAAIAGLGLFGRWHDHRRLRRRHILLDIALSKAERDDAEWAAGARDRLAKLFGETAEASVTTMRPASPAATPANAEGPKRRQEVERIAREAAQARNRLVRSYGEEVVSLVEAGRSLSEAMAIVAARNRSAPRGTNDG